MCSYVAKVQPYELDFTHQNQAQVNTYHLLLDLLFASMFESMSVALLPRSGISVHALVISFHNMLLLLFGLSSNQPPATKKTIAEKREKQIWYMKKRKQTENGKTPGSEQPVMKSICSSLTMTQRAALAIIVCR